ncbi:MAG TPA: A/G-specific adenine glycosylase [Terriglobales bacterium]|jgi:A/G-specific adenine glycosylase
MQSESSRKLNARSPAHFRRRLLQWYDANKRDLPWRRNTNPYNVWLSEIMLQQTRVAAVIDHYQRFLKRFSTVEKLAKAREASVLAAWSGLGYYRRARMLHAAAKKIVREHESNFPQTSAELRNLPGIGRYTAAAIASISFREPVAVVDGNVERVLGRVSGKHIGGEKVWEFAGQLLDANRPGDFNQAMMELGATVCLPHQPTCPVCPVSNLCRTRGALARVEKPSRQKKRTIQYALDFRDGSVFLVQRAREASLMAGMWELPELPAAPPAMTSAPSMTLRHSITVTDYTVQVVRQPAPKGANGKWVPISRAGTLPLTGLARKILRKAEVI